jgi:hypothetical protein
LNRESLARWRQFPATIDIASMQPGLGWAYKSPDVATPARC